MLYVFWSHLLNSYSHFSNSCNFAHTCSIGASGGALESYESETSKNEVNMRKTGSGGDQNRFPNRYILAFILELKIPRFWDLLRSGN